METIRDDSDDEENMAKEREVEFAINAGDDFAKLVNAGEISTEKALDLVLGLFPLNLKARQAFTFIFTSALRRLRDKAEIDKEVEAISKRGKGPAEVV